MAVEVAPEEAATAAAMMAAVPEGLEVAGHKVRYLRQTSCCDPCRCQYQ